MTKDTLTTLLSLVTLTVAAYVAFIVGTGAPAAPQSDELHAQLDRIEARLAKLEALPAAVERVESNIVRRLDRVEARAAELPSLDALAATGGSAEDDTARAAPAPEALDALAARIEEKLGARMDRLQSRQGERNATGEWKAPLDDLAKELGLTDAQKREAAALFDEARDETFVLLKTMRLDGGSLLDDFAAALKDGQDAPAATRAFFQRIFTDKVPGTDRTYLTELLELKEGVRTELGKHLSAEQARKLDALRVDLLDVKTGHDPVGDYVRSRVQ